MTLSTRFNILSGRMSALRRHMLPGNFNNTGNYREVTLDRAKGYSLLAHAEIESYFEERAEEVLNFVMGEWNRHSKPSISVISLIASYHSGWSSHNEDHNKEVIELAKSRNHKNKSIKEIINKANNDFRKILKSNHGIKEDNLRKILEPIGIFLDDLDSFWLANMDSFGTMRGQIAHTSSRTVTTEINPEDELNKINDLMSGIEVICSFGILSPL